LTPSKISEQRGTTSLIDAPLLAWALESAGFADVRDLTGEVSGRARR
jgi:hypothetical protein